MIRFVFVVLLGSLLLIANQSHGRNNNNLFHQYSRLEEIENKGTKWAVLVAGSKGYANYRHQADVCHAYQILRNGGLKDENIIVFMYDDIAYNSENPKKGIIINKPGGPDVYAGVPKDYTKEHTTADNFYAVLLGNKSALSGGSGKVLDTGPKDHVFIYYTDHGSPGILEMAAGDDIYAKDLMEVLMKKHEGKGYKSMVIYLEACEAGSMFEGILPNNINVYTTTASNAKESSYGTYCLDEYDTCLGDLYSVSWMEDCDVKDLSEETLKQQYVVVKKRTNLSHVMEYGYMDLNKEFLSTFMGADPNNINKHYDASNNEDVKSTWPSSSSYKVIDQRDADLVYLQKLYQKAPQGSSKEIEAQKRVEDEVAKRKQEDMRMQSIAKFVMGDSTEKIKMVMESVRPAGQPLVDDWDCFKMLVKSYEQHCGRLSKYGRKYSRVVANMCNAGVNNDQMVRASMQACSIST